MLDSSDIKIIQTITENGSISKAAEAFNVTQPTLSKRLARLEHVLNIPLFYRHNGGMKPTPAAEYLIESGEKIQSQLDSMARHVGMLSELNEGSINVGVGPIIEQIYFPKVLLDFTEETSNIKFRMSTETDERLLELLLSGLIDIAIGPFSKEGIPDDVIATPVKSDNIVFVGRKDHPLLDADLSGMPMEVLSRYPSIGPAIPSSFAKTLESLGLDDFGPLITCDSYAVSKSVVSVSDYLTGGPEILFEKEISEGILVEIPINLNLVWTSYCVVKPESMEIPIVKKFLEVFNTYLEN
ncbi:MAG: LysR family transcriptional regulator [Pseudomonadales bacterium]|nr:LysR family transcriptional regulator [Pseudomonadales bacterium]